MITKLYSFYDIPSDHDVCHLFEHVVLRSFLLKLHEHGYNRAFFGWLRGNTIDSTIFFDFGSYSADIAERFDTHLASLGNFDQTVITESLAHIEAEMSSTISVVDAPALLRQLELLADIVRNEATGSDIAATVSPLKVVHEPEHFEEVALLVNVFSTSETTQKAFLSLYPALFDILRDGGIDKQSAYPTGTSALAINDEGVGIAWRFNTKKNINLKKLEAATNEYLRTLDIAQYSKYIDLYQKAIARDTSYNTKVIQCYEQTGIRSTQVEFAALATDAHLREILRHMTVRFAPVKGKLKKLDWEY